MNLRIQVNAFTDHRPLHVQFLTEGPGEPCYRGTELHKVCERFRVVKRGKGRKEKEIEKERQKEGRK